jgi:RimJ/RimL family protein N-acetyltransferase
MDSDLTLSGERVTLTAFGERHLHHPAYMSWLHDREVVKTIGRPEYLTAISFEEVAEYVRLLTQSSNDMFFAIHLLDGETFVGTVKVGHINRESSIADIGIMIGSRAHWGQGIATDALSALCRYMFAEAGMRKLTCGVMANNPAMVRVFEKLGFRQEAILRRQIPFDGDFLDHILLGCFADELNEKRLVHE